MAVASHALEEARPTHEEMMLAGVVKHLIEKVYARYYESAGVSEIRAFDYDAVCREEMAAVKAFYAKCPCKAVCKTCQDARDRDTRFRQKYIADFLFDNVWLMECAWDEDPMPSIEEYNLRFEPGNFVDQRGRTTYIISSLCGFCSRRQSYNRSQRDE